LGIDVNQLSKFDSFCGVDDRREQLGKVLQETVDNCFEKYGFRKEGRNISPLDNITFANLDWDGRVSLPYFLEES
jgi:hypothetical protein